MNKSNAEQHAKFLTTTQPEHQGALQAWSTNSSGKARNGRLTMLYRIQHGLVDIHPDSYLQQSDRRTRGEHRLYQERIGSETYSYSFFPRTIRDWNMLPSGTTSAPPSVQLLDCQLSMTIVLTDFKLYIYFGPLTTDTPEHVSAAGLITF